MKLYPKKEIISFHVTKFRLHNPSATLRLRALIDATCFPASNQTVALHPSTYILFYSYLITIMPRAEAGSNKAISNNLKAVCISHSF